MSPNTRRRIVLVTSGLGTSCGGIGVVSEMIARSLKRDHHLNVWRHPFSLSRPIRIAMLTARATWGILGRPEFVFYDHVHLAVIHALLPGLSGVPYGVFLHGIEVWEPLVGRRREALAHANVLLANSPTTVNAARAVNPWLPSVKVTWLGVPPRPRVDVGSLPPVGVIVGRLASAERLKGHDVVLDAWPEICQAVPGARLVIIGAGNDQPRLRRRVREERMDTVDFPGRLSDTDRDSVLQSSRLFFSPSRQEGFGLAGVEAAAYGIPVLGLAGTVLSELFPDGTGAVLVNDTRASSIAEASVPVLTDRDYANAVGQAAWERVNANFLEQHFMDRFRNALLPFVDYEKLAGNRPKVMLA
jgi:phosphatidyl-myo-inositol dimannoside synthase